MTATSLPAILKTRLLVGYLGERAQHACLLSHRLIEFERERRLAIVVSRTNESCGRNAGQIVEESDRFRVTVEHVRMAARILGRHLFHQLFGLLEKFLVGSGVVALLLDQVFEEL